MANDVANVSAAKPKIGGAIYKLTTSAVLPQDTTTDVTANDCMGFISQDGVTNSNSPNTTDVFAWGGENVLTPSSNRADTFKMKFLEITNVAVLKTVYGSKNVTGDLESGITVAVDASDLDENAYVIDMILRDGVAKRIVIPRAKAVNISEIKYVDNDAVGYEVTLAAYPDSNGKTHYEYIKK